MRFTLTDARNDDDDDVDDDEDDDDDDDDDDEGLDGNVQPPPTVCLIFIHFLLMPPRKSSSNGKTVAQLTKLRWNAAPLTEKRLLQDFLHCADPFAMMCSCQKKAPKQAKRKKLSLKNSSLCFE